ncbi:MAG: DegV domain-containing protein [Chloroflexi bacterium]|nr:DegV domain-containing protein [Chloroflexota bacterium]
MKILTDKAANFTFEEEKAFDLNVAPLYIQFPEGEMDSAQLSPDSLYERLKAMKPKIPTTAQPSSGIFKEMYEKLAESGEKILSIHLSEGLSGTIQSARLGAEQALGADVTVFDSMTLSGGQRFQAMAASLAAKADWAMEAILERLHDIRDKVEVVYALDTLEYLAHGGRIGRVQSLLSSVLNIKPVIHVDKEDGKYSTLGKVRTLRRSIAMMTDHIEGLYTRETPLWITVLHGQLGEDAERLAAALKERLNVERLEILRVTPILGVHTGPGIVGLAAMPMNLISDLL